MALVFKRLNKKDKIRTVIPPHKQASIEKAVEAITNAANPSKALAAIRPAKLFLKAKINGSSDAEAKALAGISPQKSALKIFEQPSTQLILEEVLAQQDEFSDDGLVTRLKEMWKHKKTRFAPSGKKYKEDDTDMWRYSMDTVLELRKLKKKDDDKGATTVTQINFHVQPIPGAAPIEVKGEEIKP